MRIINGNYSSAKIFNSNRTPIDQYAEAQIKMLCDNEVSKDSIIRVMPDVHPGKVCTIGLTMTLGERIMPSLLGIDIGCGVSVIEISKTKIEFQKLDKVIKENIPSGFNVRNKPHHMSMEYNFSELMCRKSINEQKAVLSLGTLGGGNHFIEVDKDCDGNLYILIHSGSRHLGKEVTEYYLNEGRKVLKNKGISIPYELTYIEGELMESYINDVYFVQKFAQLNRDIMVYEILKKMKLKAAEGFSSVHNYLNISDGRRILRKGAISAQKDEKLVIPINMKDGAIIGRGKGNAEWNFSAPHGSGRIFKREVVKERFTLSDFKKEMKGIYSSCISKDTLDEAPFAYRGIHEILEAIGETVDIERIIRPVYSFKAGGNGR